MEVQFVASVAPIVRDAEATRAFYTDALGLSLEGGDGEYAFTEKLDGTKHFGLWPLSEAATACFGTTEWPSEIPLPQASIELEDGLREGPGWIAFARENGTVYHTYTVMAPDPFVAPYYGFLLERTPKAQPAEPRGWRKDEYPD